MVTEHAGSPSPGPVEADVPNGLAVAGFVCSLVGVFSAGLLCPIGLVLSLVALGRPGQRGFAIAGALIGAFGTMVGVLILIVAGAALLAFFGVAFLLLSGPEKLEVTADFVHLVVRVKAYEEEVGHLPDSLDALWIEEGRGLDPWGQPYQYSIIPGAKLGFDLLSAGPDGEISTDDDIRLSRLGELWKESIFVDVDEWESDSRATIGIGDRRIQIRSDGSDRDVRVWVDGEELPLERALERALDEH